MKSIQANLLRAFRHRNFALFFSGQIVSLTGTWMQSVAQSWLVYRLSDSATLLGLVAFATMFPSFLFASFGGLLADRFDRRRILVGTQSSAMTLALILAALTLTETIEIWHILVLATLHGTVNAFDIPTRQSFVVEMVGREDLPNAIALNSSMFHAARMIGPAVAGVLVATVGEGWCFFINGVSYTAVIGGLLTMKLPRRLRETTPPAPILRRLSDGWSFASRTRPIRALMMMLALVSLVGMPYATLMPIFADRILDGGARGLGILFACSGMGALGGSLTLATRRGVKGLGRWVARAAMLLGGFLLLFAFSKVFWLSGVLLVGVGAAMVVQMASSNTLIQVMVPDELRGRVMALYSMMFMGMAPFGALVAGALAERITAPLTIGIGGFFALLGGMAFAFRLPALRIEARRLIVESEMVGGDPAEEMMAHEPIVPRGAKIKIED
ncbi:MAG: MFS transporter [Thermoanaerobaculia bacterium]|nr:MFS transporter [Thermoanaerobaculia bacterium]